MARLKVFIMLIRHAASDRSIFSPHVFFLQPLVRGLRAAGLVLGLGLASAAHAGLFDDNEARQAILDLRADVKQVREGDVGKLNEQNAALQRSLLDLQAQIQEIKQNQAKQTGRIEELENRLQSGRVAAPEKGGDDPRLALQAVGLQPADRVGRITYALTR